MQVQLAVNGTKKKNIISAIKRISKSSKRGELATFVFKITFIIPSIVQPF